MWSSDVVRDASDQLTCTIQITIQPNSNTATCIPDQLHKWPEGLDHKTHLDLWFAHSRWMLIQSLNGGWVCLLLLLLLLQCMSLDRTSTLDRCYLLQWLFLTVNVFICNIKNYLWIGLGNFIIWKEQYMTEG